MKHNKEWIEDMSIEAGQIERDNCENDVVLGTDIKKTINISKLMLGRKQ